MLILPKYEEKGQGNFTFGFQTECVANAVLNKPVFKEFWNGFCCHSGEITFTQTDGLLLKIGTVGEVAQPQSGYEMVITEQGVCISACDTDNLVYGFFAFLERITPVCTKKGEETFSVPCCKVKDEGLVKTRMVHLCVFPETDMPFIKKFVRLAAFLRYTHIIVEFWGTLQYDCLKELAWEDCSFTKDEIRPVFQETRDLGLQIIPMFNHWGHAPGARVKTGKHVVLDQNLTLAPLFSQTGWEWNFFNPETVELQRKIRAELIELCGEGDYFHIGCDEAYSATTKEEFESVVDYINSVAGELAKQGRKTIMWGDMLLHIDTLKPQVKNNYIMLAPSVEMQELLLRKLSRSVVIGDWQYSVENAPVETSLFFKEQGFEVLCCPWDGGRENLTAIADTIKSGNLLGVLHTTWQTVRTMKGTWGVVYSAAENWGKAKFNNDIAYAACDISSVLRKLDFPKGSYENSGWEKKQILD
ncbi:MAG: family 20 glycosylhydrolase [Clostridia bacterium]|nr:family 20 glycosylhydrolase [Clostridia bacterium]